MYKIKKKMLYLIGSLLLFSFCNFNASAQIKDCYEICQGQSFFVLLDENSENTLWESENEDIAEVENGIIYGKNIGQTNINIKIDDEIYKSFSVRILKPEGIKNIYTYPNSVRKNEDINIVAIANNHVLKVRFKIYLNKKEEIIDISDFEIDQNNHIFEEKINIEDNGEFLIEAQEYHTDEWHDCKIITNVLINEKEFSCEERRISDDCIKIISEFEGYHPFLKRDELVLSNDCYDIGYGDRIFVGKAFYNNITQQEAFVNLIRHLNQEKTSRNVNKMLVENGIEFSQNQFDALVSFSYNIGTYWTINSTLRDILLDCHDKKLDKLDHYNKELGEDKEFNEDKELDKNAYLTNKDKFIKEFLRYHHASKQCIKGLLYRRMSELLMLFEGNYINLQNIKSHVHKFQIPECIAKVAKEKGIEL